MYDENLELERVPPQNLEAERAVLGSVFLGGRPTMDKVLAIISEGDFYKESHRITFCSALTLLDRNEEIDMITIGEELKNRNVLEKIGGNSYLVALSNTTPTPEHAEYYAKIVKQKSLARAKIQECQETMTALYNGDEPIETISKSLTNDMNIISSVRDNRIVKLGDVVEKEFNKLGEIKNDNGLTGVSTGYWGLDSICGGLQSPSFTVLAARPSMGKTTFALNIAKHIAFTKKIPCLVFSLEMSKEQLAQKYLSLFSGVNNKLFHSVKNIDDSGWSNLANGVSKAHECPIFIDDTGCLKASEIGIRSRTFKARCPELGLILVDFIQKMAPENPKMTMQEMVTKISWILFNIAKSLNVPLIALSQLNRDVEKRDIKIPQLSDLRESGSLEQDADMVWFIHRKDYYSEDKKQPDPSVTDIYIAKNRLAGGTGMIELNYYKARQTFIQM